MKEDGLVSIQYLNTEQGYKWESFCSRVIFMGDKTLSKNWGFGEGVLSSGILDIILVWNCRKWNDFSGENMKNYR